MKKLFFIALLIGVTTSVFAQSRNSSLLNDLFPSQAENEKQLKLDEMQRRLEWLEIEKQLDRDDRRAEAREAADVVRQEAEERAEQAKKEAEERAEEARDEARYRAAVLEEQASIASASNRNFVYKIFAATFVGLVFYRIRKDKRRSQENKLDVQKKTGVVIAISGVTMLLLALFVSSPWMPNLDMWQNLMNDDMTVNVWPYAQTKFVVLSCIVLIFYGALVYLEILRSPQLLVPKFDKH